MEDDNETYFDWIKVKSKTHNAFYWFNSKTNEKSWNHPSTLQNTNIIESKSVEKFQEVVNHDDIVIKKRKIDLETPKIAIIVPFRDLHIQQKRLEQLNKFIEELPKLLLTQTSNFQIYIIEQNNNDNKKFNRGKLLNIGYNIAKHDLCHIFIFHDIDLLPSIDLISSYLENPLSGPIHIAKVWKRYNKNPAYFGGIVSFNSNQFELINGFPNNFWGWGGEDDEMFKRIQKVSYLLICYLCRVCVCVCVCICVCVSLYIFNSYFLINLILWMNE